MQNRQSTHDIGPKPAEDPYLFKAQVIPGRHLIEGSDRLIFPAYYRVESRPVTFRNPDALRTREEREDYAFDWIERIKKKPGMTLLLIPHGIYASATCVIFHTGWTIIEREGEIRTHQCVVFLAGDAVPVGRSDQGVLCFAACEDLSAWDGRTEGQSRAQAT